MIRIQRDPTADGTRASASASPAGDRSHAYFEYVGRTALTVVGGVTRGRYHFPQPGAVVAVDARDRRSVAQVPTLRQVVRR